MQGEAFVFKSQMKRFLLLAFGIVAVASSLYAQYTTDGYYRVRNRGSQRYIYLRDNTGSYDMTRNVGDFGALQLWKGEEQTISDPSTLIYIKKKSEQQFDLQGQGTGIYALVSRYVDVGQVTSGPFKGSYTVSATQSGVTKYLSDNEQANVDEGVLGTSGSSPYRNWDVFRVTPTDDASFFGITPTVSVGAKYYFPFYADLSFSTYSAGMKVFTISKVDSELGLAVLSQVTGVIPASTPVLIECSSAQATANRLDLSRTSASPLAGNLLQGVYFCTNKRPKSAASLTAFTADMRVLGVTSSGKLGFVSQSSNLVTYSGVQYLPANQSYLPVASGSPAELTIVTEEEYQQAVNNRTYSLTYLVDGVVYQTQNLKAGASISPLAAPTREGYTFSGWSDIPATMPAENITVRGSFSLNSYSLIYVVDGATYQTLTVPYGTSLSAIEAPTREGHTFSGWEGLPSTMPARDVTVRGSFSKNSYTLTYMLNDVVYQTFSIPFGDALTPLESPTREGHTFSGWSDLPATMPARDVTVSGTLTANSYTVTYMLDGAVFGSQTVVYGFAVTPLDAPAREGYAFAGWSDVPETMPAHDVTVTGAYNILSFTLTYLLDGVEYSSATLSYGTPIEPLAAPQKEGHNFSGWNGLPATMPAHDVTVTGSFVVGRYTISYVLNGAGYDNFVYRTATYNFGTAVTPLTTFPSQMGYTFLGWAEQPATMPGHDVTIEGRYEATKFVVTYFVDGEEYHVDSVAYGQTLPAISDPVREGYSFDGWLNRPEVMPAQNVTVRGFFTLNSYTITFVLSGGGYEDYVLDTYTFYFGDEVFTPSAPRVPGYTFQGWTDLPQTMPARDITLVGIYSPETAVSAVRVAGSQTAYDMAGRRVSGVRSKGVYIVNGKKIYHP